jgi:hypothetical protein
MNINNIEEKINSKIGRYIKDYIKDYIESILLNESIETKTRSNKYKNPELERKEKSRMYWIFLSREFIELFHSNSR